MEAAKGYFYTPTKPHFLKPLLHGFNQGILIPIAFFKYLNVKMADELDHEALLKTNIGEWNAKIGGGFLRGQGWVDFVEHHDLQVGDVLLFKHHANLVFDVTIFDPTTCELEYTSPEDHHQSHEEEENSPMSDSNESKQQFANSSIPRSKAEASSPCFVSILKRYSFVDSNFLIPRRFATSHGLCGRHCKVLIIDAENEERTWTLSLRHRPRGEVLLAAGWGEFRDANKLAVGDVISFELIRKGSKPVMVFRRSMEEYHEPVTIANPKAEASSPMKSYPSFRAILKEYSIRRPLFYLPPEFARSHSLSNGRVLIVDGDHHDQKSWQVKLSECRSCSYSQFYLSSGWKDFRVANALKTGDILSFTLVENGKRPVMVFNKIKQKCNTVEEVAAPIIRHFTTEISPYVLKYSGLHIPGNLAKSNGLSGSCEVTVIDPEQRQWVVGVRRDNGDGSLRIQQGWRKLVFANQLEVGDIIKFERVKGDGKRIAMNLSILERSSG